MLFPSALPPAPSPAVVRSVDVFAIEGFVLALSALVVPAVLTYALPMSIVGIARTGTLRGGRGLAVAGTVVSGILMVASAGVVGLLVVPLAVLSAIEPTATGEFLSEVFRGPQ